MSDTTFREVYEAEGAYDRLLLPHYFDGREDIEIIEDLLADTYGPARQDLTVVEFGCGTGRITEAVAPYAARLTLADYSPTMIDAARCRFPGAETIVADTRDAVADLALDRTGTFDLVGAFWSLSYPIGEFFESMTATSVKSRTDHAAAHAAATAFVDGLVSLLAPGGRLVALYFDAETPEQRLVTRLWERIAPFPQGGRSYSIDVLLNGLRQPEQAGSGTLTHTRKGGTAVASGRQAALDWINRVHLKSFGTLIQDPEVQQEVEAFVDSYELADGRYALPTGVHLIDFRRATHPACHLPE
jgi:SAM-dependent methyltransferase